MAHSSPEFAWSFQRLGGLDQVVLDDPDALRRLDSLDPKLWVALSCPASGLEFDARTLELIDADKDGRIRIPEVLGALGWTLARLKDPAALADEADALPLDAIDPGTDEGRRIAATARAILENLGKPEQDSVTQKDIAAARAHASEQTFNGDGVLWAHPSFDPDVRDFIKDALAVVGGVEDAGGAPGVNREIAAAFAKTLADWLAWRRSVHDASSPVGERTAEAWELLVELKPKIDDYFLRAELAAYAPRARQSLDGEGRAPLAAEDGTLRLDSLADYPLARIEADRPLRLGPGVNPAWRARVEGFAELVRPLLSAPSAPATGPAPSASDDFGDFDDADRDIANGYGETNGDDGDAKSAAAAPVLTLTRADWAALQERFAAYAAALTGKPAPAPAAVTVPPAGSVDKLGEERARAILDGGVLEKFNLLADRDDAVPASAADIAEVERLVLLHRHLHRLLTNFVSFRDFYSLKRNASFQAGTLYIDGRACRLSMPADKIDEHAALAARSQFFLLYCRCSRGRKPGSTEAAATMNVVAAVTAGDSDLLLPGRNGVFVDNLGRDWDAAVVKVVSNPIGLWQAAWSPYKKFGNLLTEQINKFASEKQDGLMASASQKITQIGTVPAGAPTPATAPAATAPAAAAAPAKFDIGRNVGIFAAIGLAVGAIGTALAGIARALFALEWWQFPLVLLGLVLAVSGPSVIMAWLKLRQRTLGPLLEASGWAVNGRVAINYALSGRLTTRAKLPPNARRVLADPWDEKRRRAGWRVFLAALLVGALATWGILWWRERREGGEKAAAGPKTTETSESASAPAPSASAKPEPAAAREPAPAPPPEPEPAPQAPPPPAS